MCDIPHGVDALSLNSSPITNPSTAQVATRTKAVVSFGDTELDLAFVEQLVEKSQTRSIADSLLLVRLSSPNHSP